MVRPRSGVAFRLSKRKPASGWLINRSICTTWLTKEGVIRQVERLHPNLPSAKAQELCSVMVHGLLDQLRSMGPGLQVDRWIREHCPDLKEAQEEFTSEQINSNLGALQAGSLTNFPAQVSYASIAMNAAYAVFGGSRQCQRLPPHRCGDGLRECPGGLRRPGCRRPEASLDGSGQRRAKGPCSQQA
jgi:hypothetical protein